MCAYHPAEFQALTFHDAVPAFREGRDSPRKYLERCLETIDAREPTVRAWVEMNVREARSVADRSTARYLAGRELSTIDGMPVGIKDLFMTKDMPTRMGSPLFRDNHTHQDTACVQALRAAGAIVLGKTVTTELGMSYPGPTTNPFSHRHTPGGSSSGSAAAVGARMIPAAIGTQVAGSVIRPASFCANYAIKPTMGAIHRGERLALSQSHVGIHAGDLRDMWHVSIEVAKRSGGDPGYPGLYGETTLHPATRPLRVIVMEAQGAAELDDDSRDAFERFLTQLRHAGVHTIDRTNHSLVDSFERAIDESLEITRDVCAYEMRWSLENLVERFGGGLSDSLTSRLELARKMSIDDYRQLLAQRDKARAAHAAIAHIADAIVAPSSVGPAPKLDNQGLDSGISHTTGLPSYNAVTSVLGAPTITLPLLAVRGMPLGIQVIGQQHTDQHLVGLGRWISETIPARSV
ncbi:MULTISPECIES: amidase [Bradyrhizobium]|uniref:Amidase n=4 Tax=Bradyrhizobium TaxID=374 RepID=A0AAE6CCE3_9BRAD|nr:MULTISPECIES: amidase [Bradyrhizobium]MDN4988243.1 amidase [Bradyrhizobium sp. WYCCWR 13022]MDN5006303.1 amidase [Bradyrhizobium sp. WYCCWR 12677]MDT4737763.1 amidase [Bradyrhizobium sp. WYCCWR 12699]QAU43216.1 amidase [Bradyrhizobium guangdongense]QAU50710.1 amidase [Bradyrhizobium guangzhouense]